MKYIYSIFSMPLMAVGLLVFAAASGIATFIEDIYGTPAAKAVIYNALWFEILLAYLSISLILNVFRYKLYTYSKIPVFLFHLSFIVIMAGAALTRYIGIDGMMHIREGKMSNFIQSNDQFLKVGMIHNGEYSTYEEKVRISALSQKNLNTKVQVNGKDFEFRTLRFEHGITPKVISTQDGKSYIDCMISINGNPINLMLERGEVIVVNGKRVGFSSPFPVDLEIVEREGNLFFRANAPIRKENMFGGESETLESTQEHSASLLQLYQYANISLVMRTYHPSVQLDYEYKEEKARNSGDFLLMEIEVDGEKTYSWFPYGKEINYFQKELLIANERLNLSFGPVYYTLPFSIFLDDFVIHRYPGSESPSSFDSHVSVFDGQKSKLLDYHIYMNHVLHYEGWRFFQSSYDEDELGSILSVTNDEWGIRVTYLGYILLSLTMILSLFWKGTSFRYALRKLSNSKAGKLIGVFILMFLAVSVDGNAQPKADETKPISRKEVYEELSKLSTIDRGGRIKPMNTLFYELSRKIVGKNSFDGQPAQEFIPDLMIFPERYYGIRLIEAESHVVEELFGEKRKQVSLSELLVEGEQGRTYLLRSHVDAAYKKAPADRSAFDNEVIKLDERVNVLMMLQHGEFMNLFPNPADPTAEWYNSNSTIPVSGMDSMFIKTGIPFLEQSIYHAEWDRAMLFVKGIHDYQQKYAASILPSESKIRFEIVYERLNLFSKLALIFGLLSFVALAFIALSMFFGGRIWKWMLSGVHYFLWILFVVQGAGLAIRWYISGHAPFSNGYEAMLYVSWIGLLIGLILSYRNQLLLFVTGVFAAAPLLVAHLNLMSPELTNLVPVLKSYWLTIHVATITTSYAVFGFMAVVSLLNLIIMAYFKPTTNRFNAVVEEFTVLNQVLLPIALFLITIGCFLGGVWANESWGTYWSWDPKEVWCLVSILVYSFVAHMHHIKGLQGRFYLNLFLFFSFSTILMTYFGVNYFLGGMHSYGKGAAFDLSLGTWIFFGFLLVTSLIGVYRETAKK
jgi:cytochrome c-type biogenesis protein CcsB